MPIAFRSATTSVGVGSVTLPKPPGLQVGDIMPVLVSITSPTPPTGWTLLGTVDFGAGSVYIKTATAADVAASSFLFAGSGGASVNGVIAAWSGASGWGVPATIDNASSNIQTIPALTVQGYGSRVVALHHFNNNAVVVSYGVWTARASSQSAATVSIMDRAQPKGAMASSTIQMGNFAIGGALVIELFEIPSESVMQSVATLTAEGSQYRGTTVIAQSVATLISQPGQRHAAEASMQGAFRHTAEATGTHALDFTNYDAYIETPNDFFGLLFFNEEKPRTVSRRLQPVRQDVGNNPAEIRPEFGDIFAQNDFSHGGGQTYFHALGRDPKRYFTSEGFDISEPGRLTHLHSLSPAIEDTETGPMTQANGLPFIAVGEVVKRGDGNLPGVWTDEDPAPGSGGGNEVLSLTTEGDRMFAALGFAGVNMRRADGVWGNFQPDGSTDLDISPAHVVSWVKDRLMVAGWTDARRIYEVTADSTPTEIDTLKEGWRFVSIGEAGGFIQACAVNLDASQSVIYSYGLNDAASAIERKSSTPMPIGQLAWVVSGYIGTAFIGGGRVNSQGGYDPFLYRASVNQLGELDYTLIRQEEGSAAADLSVRAITPIGESVLVSWTLGSGARFGEARDGIAIYNLARDSFARHLRREGAGGANKVLDILPYKGRLLVAIESFGLFYENLNDVVDEASIVTSLADWNNAGNKVWDQIELSHDALPIGTSATVEYTTKAQEVDEWSNALISQTPGAEGAVSRLSTTTSRVFALRISSFANSSTYPVTQSFAVRSHPSPERPEWDLTRYVRLLSEDQKDDQAETIFQDPREVAARLRRAVNTWVTFYESGVTWTAFLTDVSAYEPDQPFYDTASGEPLRDAFIVQLQLTGTEGP